MKKKSDMKRIENSHKLSVDLGALLQALVTIFPIYFIRFAASNGDARMLDVLIRDSKKAKADCNYIDKRSGLHVHVHVLQVTSPVTRTWLHNDHDLITLQA